MSKKANLRHLRSRRAARHPAPSGNADTLARIETLTKMARTSWFGLLSYLAFVGVTLLGVEDADFFITERETQLPLIGVSIPTNLFFYIAPTLGAMLYIHMHLYLLKLWKALHDLPEGNSPAGESIAPWIVSDMALARRPGAHHPYPLKRLANTVAFASIFLFAPLVLAGFWWRSMPKHDELLTMVFCGLPLFVSLVAGVASWRMLRGTTATRLWTATRRTAWTVTFLALTTYGFLTTEGTFSEYAKWDRVSFAGTAYPIFSFYQREHRALVTDLAELTLPELKARVKHITLHPDPDFASFGSYRPELTYLADRLLAERWWMRTWYPNLFRPAKLSNVEFVETPRGWLPYDEAQQVFRAQWCTDQGIPHLACGPGPLARDKDGDSVDPNPILARHQALWCTQLLGKDDTPEDCSAQIAQEDERYAASWERRHKDALAALPPRSLSDLDLRRAHLWEARLEGANLQGARLEGAILGRARLEGADLRWARLERASLGGARLEGANLQGARLERANLGGARLEGANLQAARLEGADLRWARLEGAFLGRARLEGADLEGARLEGAHLSEVRLQGAFLGRARLEGAFLSEARLQGAHLSEARLQGAFLGGARLEGANLQAARLEGAFLGGARLEGANLQAARLEWAFLGGARLEGNRSLSAAALRGAALTDLSMSDWHMTQQQLDATFGDASVTDLDKAATGPLTQPDHWPKHELDFFEFSTEWRKWQADPEGYTPPPPPEAKP
ncbi:pentapeptide repeat-containing protein [Sagittula sp. S175]|uniref:pentapeptide repeat-containing protein n=1 Tax=Sagittula sp. S175 TaxID=3415129 RepID=UPI003C7E840D